MRLIACPDHEAMSRAARDRVLDAIRAKPDLTLCLPTGDTPGRLYALLTEERRRAPDLFARLRVVKLDEWIGGGRDFPGSCERYLRERVLEPWGVSDDRYLGFDLDPADPAAECARVAARLAEWGRLDLCVLGLGLSGHFGFNEPGADPAAGPHVARLTPETLRHPMAAGADPARLRGITLGLGDILGSRQVLLLVAGAGKRAVFRRFVHGPVSNECPASWLRKRSNAECLYDASAVEP